MPPIFQYPIDLIFPILSPASLPSAGLQDPSPPMSQYHKHLPTHGVSHATLWFLKTGAFRKNLNCPSLLSYSSFVPPISPSLVCTTRSASLIIVIARRCSACNFLISSRSRSFSFFRCCESRVK